MRSEIKKDELLQDQENLQISGQENPNNSEAESMVCECEYCLRPSKPRLQFESAKGRRRYFQTRSKKENRG
jgi:hypothetical protein